jgi:hypothetical protein
MIISDFGFGKTSLLLQFFLMLINEGYIPLFLPVSSFRNNTFTNTSNIAKEVFRTVTQLDLENDKILKFSAESMDNLFKTNPKIIIMFDGLDEHRDLYHHESLKTLLESSINWVSPTIFSFRKSFRDERNAEFQIPINTRYRRHNVRTEIFLTEWNAENIKNYLKLFEKNNFTLLNEEQKLTLQKFSNLIDTNEYEHYYGDIPKRPLFLEMIVRDILSDKIKQTNLSKLYYNYFSEKFERDLTGQIIGVSPKRHLPEKGIEATRMSLIQIHEEIARECIKQDMEGDSKRLSIENVVKEESINNILKECDFILDIGKFLIVSILIPISGRTNYGLRIRFAHTSFLEYFIARVLLKDFYDQKIDQRSYSEFEFPIPVLNFLRSMIETEKRENRKYFQMMLDKYKDISCPICQFIRNNSL